MTRINTNVSSLVAQNRLNRTNNDLQTSLTRLSTGLRINTGKDDPAGLIASESLRSDITSINKAISNTRRATQIIATADSALGQVSSLLNDVRGLVVEAANTGALSDDEIAANQLQIDSSLAAINRIAQTTTFQGRKLLDGSLDFKTTSGANFTKLSKVQINQANLGSAGSANLKIEVTSAATRAQVTLGNIPAAGVGGTGTITLTNAAPNAEASTAAQTTAAGGDFKIAVKDGTTLDGTKGNAVRLNVVSGATAATAQAGSGVQSTSNGDFLIGVKAGSQFDGLAGNDVDVTIESGNTAIAQATSVAQDVNGSTGALTIRAKVDGDYDGAAGNALTVVIQSDGGATGIEVGAVAANTLTINVEDDRSYSLAEIKAALEADGDFNADFEIELATGAGSVLFRNDGSDDLSFDLDGAVAGADAAAKVTLDTSGANPELVITVNDNQAENLSDIKAALEASAVFSADFTFNVGVDGTFAADGSEDAADIDLTGGDNVAAEATFADNVLTVTVNDYANVQLSDIKAAFDLNTAISDRFDFTVTTDNAFANDGTDNKSNVAFAGGTDTTSADVITVTGPAGQAKNGNINVVQSATATTPSAAVDADGNITVTISNSTNTTLSSIASAIGTLSGYSATISSTAGDRTFAVATDSFATVGITGATDGGLTNDVVFQLGGKNGAQVFQVAAGTTIDQLISQVNLVSEATGVEARDDNGSLVLQSTAFGSKATVDLRVIEEVETGLFTTELGVRTLENGRDVVAKINGVDASGDGNSLRVNTSTLDIELSLEADFSGNIDFAIIGGGAQFQLGPEVVANQQARIGISSLNTAQLGGVAGKLYQLAEGGSASLTQNTTLASEIVDAAINQVTGLRGRLGAFQATALESNLVSLSETVNNLTEAESSIRDADFAQESARLTRNQILVQSGTNVLALANQNPQNVLALLR
jgi:flagellin